VNSEENEIDVQISYIRPSSRYGGQPHISTAAAVLVDRQAAATLAANTSTNMFAGLYVHEQCFLSHIINRNVEEIQFGVISGSIVRL
jgi:hypothetical protein